MTSEVYRPAMETVDREVSGRRVLLSPTGWYTRYMLRSYVQHVFVMTTGLIIIALSIELSWLLPRALASDGSDPHGGLLALQFASHAGLRIIDFATRMLPLGCFLGVLASEVSHTLSRERVTIWNSGRSPMQCLTPVLIFAVCAGALQFSMEAYVRPATVKMQAASWMGPFAKLYDRSQVTDRYWLVGGADLIQARIEYGPPVVLHDVMIYRHDRDGKLSEIISARRAAIQSDGRSWRLYGGNKWFVDAGAASQSSAEAAAARQTGQAAEYIDLDLSPLWLSNHRIHASELPHEVLGALANSPGGQYRAANYQTWLHLRYAQWLYPGAMALLACSWALFLLGQQVRLEAVLAIGFAGYLGHISLRICLLLGENGYLSPILAGWLAPVFVFFLAGVAVVLAKLSGVGMLRPHRQAG